MTIEKEGTIKLNSENKTLAAASFGGKTKSLFFVHALIDSRLLTRRAKTDLVSSINAFYESVSEITKRSLLIMDENVILMDCPIK